MGTNDDLDPPAAAGTGPEPAAPKARLPVRASIYIDVDGTVHFGALFDSLVPVADALGARQPDDDDTEDALAEAALAAAPTAGGGSGA